ncbi:MAG TPA: hypothetical protein VKG01_15345 [Thermoanaerobaculia bacterium]|nr:hypothetical protein [Thermoanaerobaculia bacterium]
MIASVVTIALTVFNAVTKSTIDRQAGAVQAAQLELQKLDERLRERAADLEALKERTSRYTFLRSLLPDLISGTGQQQLLTINLIRLTLSEEEAARFFSGFIRSDDRALQTVGNAGLKAIAQDRTASETAAGHERKGFASLMEGRFDQAIVDFRNADRAYPAYHDASEIAQYLEQSRKDLERPDGRRAAYGEILKRYSWKAPPDVRRQLRDLSQDASGDGPSK